MIKIYSPSRIDFRKRLSSGKTLFKGSLLRRICCLLVIIFPLVASAQQTITGTVKDSKGVAVIGATVSEKGTTNAVGTDVNGKFRIALKNSPGTIVISFIGYKTQTIAVGSQTNISVILLDDQNQLNDVVVIGYGAVKKSDVTGSVSTIKSSELTLGGTVSNLGQAIQGKAAGVLVQQSNFAPGGGIAITIRGGNSINASNEPLYVIDGFISD